MTNRIRDFEEKDRVLRVRAMEQDVGKPAQVDLPSRPLTKQADLRRDSEKRPEPYVSS